MTEKNNWATGQVKEVPFWRDGMTPEEYDVEREYLYKSHWNDYMQGKYLPLWVQKADEETATAWRNRFYGG